MASKRGVNCIIVIIDHSHIETLNIYHIKKTVSIKDNKKCLSP